MQYEIGKGAHRGQSSTSHQNIAISENDDSGMAVTDEVLDQCWGTADDIAISQEEFINEFKYLATTRSGRRSKDDSEKVKKLFVTAWRNRKLSCDMEPQELALGLTKIKIDLYEHDMTRSIGILATNHLKRMEKSQEYIDDYEMWSRKYKDGFEGAVRKIEEEE